MFDLTNQDNKPLNDSFVIFNRNYKVFIERNEVISLRVSDVNFEILFKCEDYNCDLDENATSYFYNIFHMKFLIPSIDHQRSNPIMNDGKLIDDEEFPFYSNYLIFNEIQWQVIKYEEELGLSKLFYDLFKIDYEYTYGYIESVEKVMKDSNILYVFFLNETAGKIEKYRVLGSVKINHLHNKYLEYKRKSVSILDIIANISALSSTVLSFISYIFKYYSENFNSYKILESI